MVQLIIGSLAGLTALTLHTFVVAAVIVSTPRVARDVTRPRFFRIVSAVLPSALTLLFAHFLEVGLWAAVYWLLGVTNEASDAFYFASVNYTTLGYGDVRPTSDWRLLGPMAAGCGIMLFGLSTAALFEVLRQTALSVETVNEAAATRPRP